MRDSTPHRSGLGDDPAVQAAPSPDQEPGALAAEWEAEGILAESSLTEGILAEGIVAEAQASHRRDGGGDLLRRILTYMPGSVIPAALTFATSMVFTRLFDADEYGAYGLALVYATMFKLATSNWLTQSVGRFLPAEQDPEARRSLKSAIMLSAVAIVLVELVLGGVFVLIATQSGTSASLAAPALFWVVSASLFEVLGAVFAAEHRAAELASYQVLSSIGVFVLRLLLVLTLLEGEVTAMFWGIVLVNLTMTPLLWARAKVPGPTPKAIWVTAGSASTRARTSAFLAFGLPMTLWLVPGLLMDVGDRFVINALLGTSAVGIYDANYRLIAGVATLLIAPITITLHPFIMAMTESGRESTVGRIISGIIENLIVLGAFSSGLALIFHADIALLLGPAFREGSVIMPAVVVGMFALHIGSFAHKPFEIARRTRPMVVLAFVGAAINLALNYALIPVVGYIGAAYATALSFGFYAVSVGLLGRRIIPWRLDLVATLRDTVAIGVGLAIAAGLRTLAEPVSPLGALAVAGGVVVLLGIWMLRRIRRSAAQLLPTPTRREST